MTQNKRQMKMTCVDCGTEVHGMQGLASHRKAFHNPDNPLSDEERERKMRQAAWARTSNQKRRAAKKPKRTTPGRPRSLDNPAVAFEADEKAARILAEMYPHGIPTDDEEKLVSILHFTDHLRNQLREGVL